MKRDVLVSGRIAALSRPLRDNFQGLLDADRIHIGTRQVCEGMHIVSVWDPPVHGRYSVFETGFFWDSGHVDRVGLFQYSSLNTPAGLEAVRDFEAPVPASTIVFDSKEPRSKYRQKGDGHSWPGGVVLAAQNPTDRSILRGGSEADYWRFFDGACKKYGKHLFVKLHPRNTPADEKRMREIASEHGCRCEKTTMNILHSCKFVLVYNSTFAVDCFLYRAPVAQFAPGYFWQTPAVTFTNGEYPDSIGKGTLNDGSRLADFLIWRYCIHLSMPLEKWVRFFRHIADSDDLFPVTEEFCYAAQVKGNTA